MRTNIVIDQSLLEEVQKITGLKTKKAAVEESLKFFIEMKKRKNLSDLEGKIQFWDGYDHKKLRE